MTKSANSFALPTYAELPTVGLYLKQVTAYINQVMAPFDSVRVTSSMISNYVKHRLITRPHKRLYSREQIAQLLFIVVAKNVLDQDELRVAIQIQMHTYDVEIAYNYFAAELQNVTEYVFGERNSLAHIGRDHTNQKQMLRNIIMAFAYQAYLHNYFHTVDLDRMVPVHQEKSKIKPGTKRS